MLQRAAQAERGAAETTTRHRRGGVWAAAGPVVRRRCRGRRCSSCSRRFVKGGVHAAVRMRLSDRRLSRATQDFSCVPRTSVRMSEGPRPRNAEAGGSRA